MNDVSVIHENISLNQLREMVQGSPKSDLAGQRRSTRFIEVNITENLLSDIIDTVFYLTTGA